MCKTAQHACGGLQFSPSTLLRKCLLFLQLCCICHASWPLLSNSPVSSSHLAVGVLGLQVCATSAFVGGIWRLNSAIKLARSASLPAEPSSMPLLLFVLPQRRKPPVILLYPFFPFLLLFQLYRFMDYNVIIKCILQYIMIKPGN